MKNSFISNLYFMNNDTGLFEKVQKTEEYQKLSDEAYGYYLDLEKKLNEEHKDLFLKFVDTNMDANCETNEQSFIAGFKCGIKLAVECLCDDEI